MKRTFTSSFLGLAISGLLLASCSQMASYENEDLALEQARADKAGFTLSPFSSKTYENALLSENDGFSVTFTGTICAGEDLEFEFGGANFLGTKTIQIQQLIDGIWVQVFQQQQAPSGFSGSISDLSVGTHTFRWKIAGGPQNIEFNVVVEDCSTCDEELFDYNPPVFGESGVDVTFVYNYSEEAIISIDFTFPHILDETPNGGTYTGEDGKTYKVTGNGTVFHWTGPVSCSSEKPTTFAFKGLIPDCGPSTANDGLANIWTEAKVVAINGVQLVDDLLTEDIDEGPYSLKGDLASIVYKGCPTKSN